MAYAVIGANFGDEGKGREVSRLVMESKGPSLVIRHNSGAQAGHTVCDDHGRRHVFSHFGSGTLHQADTLLAHKFVVNPIIFNREFDELMHKQVSIPKIYVDYDCIISTPLDILLNRIMEHSRGVEKHGSCGLGFGETIERSLNPDLRISVRNFKNITRELEQYFLNQLFERDIMFTSLSEEYFELCRDVFNGEFNWAPWIDELEKFSRRVRPLTSFGIQSVVSSYKTVIFEGAQGLLLDQDHEYFPHVTRSRTGLSDIVEMIEKYSLDIKSLKPHYCTRTYVTRHGAGPLPDERTKEEMISLGYDIEDETNVPNPYQDSLRYAPLDVKNLINNIEKDISKVEFNLEKVHIAFSCADQVNKSLLHKFVVDDYDQSFGMSPNARFTFTKENVKTGGFAYNDAI